MTATKMPTRANIKGGEIVGASIKGSTLNADDTTPPAVISGGGATSRALRVKLTWTNPTDQDFSHVEVHRNTTNTSVGATKLWEGKAAEYRDESGTAGTTYYYFAKAVDWNGNKSAFTAIGSAAPALVALASEISGAGTAAAANTGTTGTAVPLLSGSNQWGGPQTFNNSAIVAVGELLLNSGVKMRLSQSPNLTIASDAITLTGVVHTVLPESGTTDNLNRIIGTSGQFFVLLGSSGKTITVKHGTFNIYCGADFTLDEFDTATFWYSGSEAYLLCRSAN
jgi:hypothetical protein